MKGTTYAVRSCGLRYVVMLSTSQVPLLFFMRKSRPTAPIAVVIVTCTIAPLPSASTFSLSIVNMRIGPMMPSSLFESLPA